MALQSDRQISSATDIGSLPAQSHDSAGKMADGFIARLVDWMMGLAQRIRNWITGLTGGSLGARLFTSLAKRIFVANLIGLLFLIGGMYYFSQHQTLVFKAKTESLRIQGEIIAAAIAADAQVVGSDGITFDPDNFPLDERSLVPFRQDAFATLELSMSPERVVPMLRHLILKTNNSTRARVYTREFTMIADSDQFLTQRGFAEPDVDYPSKGQPKPELLGKNGKPIPLTSFWTKWAKWILPNSPAVYRVNDNVKVRRYAEVRSAMKSGVPMELLFLNDSGQHIVSIAMPIKRNKITHGVLLLSSQPGDIDKILARERRAFWILSTMALLTTLLASTLLIQSISRPMRRLSAAAIHVRQNIKARAELPEFPSRIDEVGKLAVAFRDMTAALYRRIEASEKFAADVAHELKNPLTAARGTAEALSYAKSDEQRDELVEQITMELKRLNRLITDVASASRLDAELALQDVEPVDISVVLGNVADGFSDYLSGKPIDVVLDVPQLPDGAMDLVVNGHEGRLGQVLTNLVDNAISFSPDGGVVTLSARRIGAEIELRVEDQGGGIPIDKLEAVFSRFYSDRPVTDGVLGKNSGLGLSISREIIRAHDGRIWAINLGAPLIPLSRNESMKVGNRKGAGAAFIVRLPAAYKIKTRSKRWS